MILSTKVIVLDINNLTDARYFAAWGVDMIAFSMKENTLIKVEEMIEIMNWIEGPDYLLQVVGTYNVDHLFEYLSKTKITKVICDSENIDSIRLSFPELEVFIFDGTFLKLGSKQFIKVETKEDLIKMESEVVDGVVLLGGDEEKAGFKSFDDMDEIFEKLESN